MEGRIDEYTAAPRQTGINEKLEKEKINSSEAEWGRS
jgi:hypothetical protein